MSPGLLPLSHSDTPAQRRTRSPCSKWFFFLNKDYIQKSWNLHLFLERSMRNSCQAAEALCGPETNGSCAFAINVCTRRMQKTSPPRGRKGRNPSQVSLCAQWEWTGCLGGKRWQQWYHPEASKRSHSHWNKGAKGRRWEAFSWKFFSDDHNPYPMPDLG